MYLFCQVVLLIHIINNSPLASSDSGRPLPWIPQPAEAYICIKKETAPARVSPFVYFFFICQSNPLFFPSSPTASHGKDISCHSGRTLHSRRPFYQDWSNDRPPVYLLPGPGRNTCLSILYQGLPDMADSDCSIRIFPLYPPAPAVK